MGAGPVPIPVAVAQANGVIINHLGPLMDLVIQNVKQMAAYVFQTRSDKIIGLSGPTSAAMEMAVANLCWPGRKVLCLKSGTFSGRLGEMALGVGADVTVLESEAGRPVSADQVRQALKQGRFDVVTMSHGETSCGVCMVDLPEVCRLTREHGALTIVDAGVTSERCRCTWMIGASTWASWADRRGCLRFLACRSVHSHPTHGKTVEGRPLPRPHWCYDALRAQRFWGHQQYHYTAPVPGILALHEALRLIGEETLERRFRRHEMAPWRCKQGWRPWGWPCSHPKRSVCSSVIAIDMPGEQIARACGTT